ncbi:flagellar biosynthesis regulator FlaF [Novosphingobium sp. ST904]|uniref:flagellar biosynthesis regulator FlaF n=1 Tax=Novosphingobium sp. ST904 TaxID=1684385 RepID=UPI0035174197
MPRFVLYGEGSRPRGSQHVTQCLSARAADRGHATPERIPADEPDHRRDDRRARCRPSRRALAPSLHRNRQAWTTFSTMCATEGNQLPDDLRARIISIGMWVEKYTSQVITGRDTIDDLIVVNRAIIEGLANENGTGN